MKESRVPKTNRAGFCQCRICGCTYERACPVGCSWAEADLCSVCARFKKILTEYVESALNVSQASLRRLLAEVTPRKTMSRSMHA